MKPAATQTMISQRTAESSLVDSAAAVTVWDRTRYPATSDAARRVSGGRNPKCSRSVDVEYSVRYAPRSCSSGINQSTISSSPVGTRYGEILKPSEAPLRTQWTN